MKEFQLHLPEDEASEEGEEYALEPPDPGVVPGHGVRITKDVNQVWDEHNRAEAKTYYRFTIIEWMGGIAIAAVALTLTRWLTASYAAALLGFAVLVALLVPTFGQHAPRWFYFVWWILLILYVTVAAAAVLQSV